MVERAARAIWDKANPDCGTWDQIPEHWRPPFREQARAAIASLRKPSRAMSEAAALRMHHDCGHLQAMLEFREEWQAAIAALLDQPEHGAPDERVG